MDIRKIALSLLLLIIAAMPVSANPYCIYGGGNCVYFAYECVERFWPMTPNIPRSWDAGDWVQIVGQGNSEYQIIQANSVQPGDIFVLPKSESYPLGHVGFIVETARAYDFSNNTYVEYYTALESGMYADETMFPYELKGCNYRKHPYWKEEFEEAVVLRCIPK